MSFFPAKEQSERQDALPDPFLKSDSSRIRFPSEWPEHRHYLKSMLSHYLYGDAPDDSCRVKGDTIKSEPVYGGRAIRETVLITCGPEGLISFEAVITRPAKPGLFPAFVWNQFPEMHPCPIEEEAVAVRNYVIAMFNRNQLAPDDMGSKNSISQCQCAKAYPGFNWRAIAMWAWGQSRLADYLVGTGYADPEKLISTGFSRGGKVALRSAAYDERFALCAAAGSGCGGAGSFRFMGGRMGLGSDICESLGAMTRSDRFWYWFSDICATYGNHEIESAAYSERLLPFDLHFIRALISPRPLITTDGLDDAWANPYGTQLSWAAAEPVYAFLGASGSNAIFFREGGHDFNSADWNAVLDFCDSKLLSKDVALSCKTGGADKWILDGKIPWRMPEAES
ncbi:MAG: hypothetical protein LBU32_15980 [Clostridiales bacterium]|jgi:hypothetical protein|nr:hypothetical protein [Clostridiales bacterium]